MPKNFLLRYVVPALLFLSPMTLLAQSTPTQAQLDALRERLAVSLEVATANQLHIANLIPTAMANVIEVELDTGEVLYSSLDGGFVFAGDMFRAGSDGLQNLSAERRQVKNLEKIAAVPTDEMIIFSPTVQTRATITVFTDVDCQYCRALHRDMDKLLDKGIEVRYMAYPRGGEQAGSFQKMISVWCSSDRKKALSQAKNGQDLPSLTCDNPVLKHYALGNDIGITGTPAILFPDGTLLPGYVDADRLAAMLGLTD